MLKNRIISSVIVDTDKVVQTEGFEFKHYIHSDAMFAIESFLNWSVDELVIINVSREDNNFEKLHSLSFKERKVPNDLIHKFVILSYS